MTNLINSEAISHVGPRELKEAVGSLVLLWSKVERCLSKAVEEMGGKAPHGIRRTLNAWGELHGEVGRSRPEHEAVVNGLATHLETALRIRNGICHGHADFQASSEGDPELAYLRYELNGDIETVTLSTLFAYTRGLSGAISHISRLTTAAIDRESRGLQSLYDDVRDLMEKQWCCTR